jgi:hypothetical protein
MLEHKCSNDWVKRGWRTSRHSMCSRRHRLNRKPTVIAVLLVELRCPHGAHSGLHETQEHGVVLLEPLAALGEALAQDLEWRERAKLLTGFAGSGYLKRRVFRVAVSARKSPRQVVVPRGSEEEEHFFCMFAQDHEPGSVLFRKDRHRGNVQTSRNTRQARTTSLDFQKGYSNPRRLARSLKY